MLRYQGTATLATKVTARYLNTFFYLTEYRKNVTNRIFIIPSCAFSSCNISCCHVGIPASRFIWYVECVPGEGLLKAWPMCLLRRQPSLSTSDTRANATHTDPSRVGQRLPKRGPLTAPRGRHCKDPRSLRSSADDSRLSAHGPQQSFYPGASQTQDGTPTRPNSLPSVSGILRGLTPANFSATESSAPESQLLSLFSISGRTLVPKLFSAA